MICKIWFGHICKGHMWKKRLIGKTVWPLEKQQEETGGAVIQDSLQTWSPQKQWTAKKEARAGADRRNPAGRPAAQQSRPCRAPRTHLPLGSLLSWAGRPHGGGGERQHWPGACIPKWAAGGHLHYGYFMKTEFHLIQAMYKLYHGNSILKFKKWSCS